MDAVRQALRRRYRLYRWANPVALILSAYVLFDAIVLRIAGPVGWPEFRNGFVLFFGPALLLILFNFVPMLELRLFSRFCGLLIGLFMGFVGVLMVLGGVSSAGTLASWTTPFMAGTAALLMIPTILCIHLDKEPGHDLPLESTPPPAPLDPMDQVDVQKWDEAP